MNTKHISLAFVTVAALLAGCAKSSFEEPIDGQFADLELSYVGATETKAAIDGTTFPTDGEIGLFLFTDEAATTPYGDGYVNVKYSYNSTKEKWTASPSIKVGSTPGYLYGYYPYSGTAADIKAIPVSSSLNGDDMMYAAKQSSPITDVTASQTTITMNHALARVSVKVINNGYTGNAKLSQIKFEGAKLAASGTLDATNGKITATKADNVALSVPEAGQTIATGDGSTYECLLVPSEINSNRQDVTLSLTIDGQNKTATLSGNDNGVIFAQGTQSNITITLSNSGISVRTISVESWNVIEVGGHKFTLKLSEEDEGIADNLTVQCKPESSSVKVEVYSKEVKQLVIRIGDDTRIIPDKDANFCTFTISDITSDITATLAYAKTFKVTGKVVADVTPVEGYINNVFEGLGNVFEGRPVTMTVKAGTVPGYNFKKMVCDGRTVTGDTIVLEGISKDLEVSAHYEFYDYPLSGVFTVADCGEGKVRKVRFARGNLWYQNGVLHNEDEQYQFSSSNWAMGGHISLFMWCRSLAESANQLYKETATSSNDNFFTNAGDDHLSPNPDLIVNGQKGIWRVLSGGTGGEWDYLLNTRTTTYGHRYAAVKVNGMPGCLIFPDDFTWPSGAGDQPSTFDAASTDWNGVNYEGDAFAALQAAGCVFLPAAGFRYGIAGKADVRDVGRLCHYWSASPSNDGYALGLYFSGGNVVPTHSGTRDQACAVRLVTESSESFKLLY